MGGWRSMQEGECTPLSAAWSSKGGHFPAISRRVQRSVLVLQGLIPMKKSIVSLCSSAGEAALIWRAARFFSIQANYVIEHFSHLNTRPIPFLIVAALLLLGGDEIGLFPEA